jgi:hypothetical protein
MDTQLRQVVGCSSAYLKISISNSCKNYKLKESTVGKSVMLNREIKQQYSRNWNFLKFEENDKESNLMRVKREIISNFNLKRVDFFIVCNLTHLELHHSAIYF